MDKGGAWTLSGALAGAIVAEIVFVDTVDDVGDVALFSELLKHGEEFVLAEEAALRVVADVLGAIKF